MIEMKKLIIILIIGLLSFASNVFALEPNEPGELEAYIVVSDTPDFIDEWMSTPFEKDIHMKRIKEVRYEQMFHIAVLVTGFVVNRNSRTDITADFILENPNRTIQFNEKDMFTHGRKMHNLTGFLMLDPAIDLAFEETDKPGKYTIKVKVTDRELEKTVKEKYIVVLTEEPNIEE